MTATRTKADIAGAIRDVCFTPESGHRSGNADRNGSPAVDVEGVN